MKNIKALWATIFVVMTLATTFAQGNPYGDYERNDNNRNGSRRFSRRCTEPFPARSFNRDYAGLSNTNFYHIDKELKDYTKNRCLTSEQIRRLALLIPTDREKYDYLTASLNSVFDIENFAMAGAVLMNRNAKDGFYRFLVREGVPAGDYYTAEPVYYANGYCATPPPPQYYDRYGNNSGNRNMPNNDPYYGSNNNNYGQNNGSGNNNSYGNPQNAQGQAGINSGYRGLMTYKEFEVIKEQIKQNTFDKGKLDAAKNLTQSNVLTTNQIAEIARMFNMDNNRLEYAKFAYDYAYDRDNYTAVGEAMAFESNKKELQRYVENRKRG